MDEELEAKGEAETLARHKAALLANAKRLGRNISEIYSEVVSADSIAARPEMQRLLKDVDAGKWDAVHVMEVERLARGDSLDQGIVARAFKYSETLIITPIKTYDPTNEFDEEYFEFGLFMSRREYKAITRRMQRGRVASVMEGKWPSNKAPYGYSRVKLDGQKGWTLEPIPAEADVVRDIFRWYTEGYAGPDGAHRRIGISLIVRRLNESGVTTQTGQDWTNAVVRDMLRNPAYAGFVRWGFRPSVKRVVDGQVVITTPRADPANVTTAKGLHPALVSKEIYDAAQEYLTRNESRPGPKQMIMKNPLSGLIICGNCGRAMVRRPYKSGYPDGLICPYTSCSTVSSDLSTVESALLDALRLWYADLSAGNPPASARDDSLRLAEARVKAADDEIAKLRAQQTRAYDLVEQGVYTTEVFLSRSRDLADRQAAAELEKIEAGKELVRLRAIRQTQNTQLPRLKHVLDAYSDAATPEEKNALLKSVLEKAVYKKSRRARSAGGSDMTLDLYPRLPSTYHR